MSFSPYKTFPTTQDLITPPLPLTTITTKFESGQIAFPIARIFLTDRDGQNTSHKLTEIPFRGDS